jgi:hypothetical protein
MFKLVKGENTKAELLIPNVSAQSRTALQFFDKPDAACGQHEIQSTELIMITYAYNYV